MSKSAPRPNHRPAGWWDVKVYFEGRPTPRRVVLDALAAHRVPEAYIAAFIDTAEEVGVAERFPADDPDLAPWAGKPMVADTHPELVLQGEINAIMAACDHRDDRLTPEDRKRIAELRRRLEELLNPPAFTRKVVLGRKI